MQILIGYALIIYKNNLCSPKHKDILKQKSRSHDFKCKFLLVKGKGMFNTIYV